MSFEEEVMYKLGSIEARLKRMNGDMDTTKKKVAKHDIIFGKAGIIVTAVLFVFAIAINFITDIIKVKFLK